jgi:hypothetical protein
MERENNNWSNTGNMSRMPRKEMLNGVAQHPTNQHLQVRLKTPHRLLQKSAVEQFAQPILAVVDFQNVLFGGRARLWIHSDTVEWNWAETLDQIDRRPHAGGELRG